MFFIFINFILLHSSLSSSNTYVFSGTLNTYIAFDSWRACLTGFIRFDIRTDIKDGTLAYIDDRGKFDFFYLKLLEGKPRLLFNLGNDRQAINVNMKINDDKWHTILIKRHGQITSLIIDHGHAQNSTITHSEDLFFGGASYDEYQASPFYFGGIPADLERPSSGNLSSYDVYMQPRFRGQLRNLIYQNCTDTRLIQPVEIQMSGGVSLIPNHYCSGRICGEKICLITENNYQCLCEKDCETMNQYTFSGKVYAKYDLMISSASEILTFEFKTNQYDGFLFELIPDLMNVKFKQGQLMIEYRMNRTWHELITKDLVLVDNQWHFVQMKRKLGQMFVLIDQVYLPFENDLQLDGIWNFTEIFIGGNQDLNLRRFSGCLKDISMIFNENVTIDLNQSLTHLPKNCHELIHPIQFLIPSSFISFELTNHPDDLTFSFRFETYSSDCILLYAQSNEDFLGLDLIDGFFYLTLNIKSNKQRQELFQQRFNDGQSHFIQLHMRLNQRNLELNITMDYRQYSRILTRNLSSRVNFQTMTIGGVNPSFPWLPTNYFSGITHRGFVGCFSDLEINTELINLTKYIDSTSDSIPPSTGPCSLILSTKRECLCEHDGECRLNNAGIWSCDCSKTGYTGQRCEQLALHLDLNEIQTFEFNTNLQWSEQMNDIAFRLQAKHDEDNFLLIRSCQLTSQCDSISFSIRNGLLLIKFYSLNLSSEYPFLLDYRWHSIHLQRFEKNFLLHIDNQIIQQRVNLTNFNSSSFATIWIVFYGNKQIQIEDLRVYDQLIYSKLYPHDQMQLKARVWKAWNAVSFDEKNSSIDIQFNEILCQECQLESIYFQFRTIELNGLLLSGNIQTTNPKNSLAEKSNEYLLLKLIHGQLQLILIDSTHTEFHRIETKVYLNNGHWHHISLYRASDHHLELTINSNKYYLLRSVYFLEKISIGHSLKACFASLTINSHTVNLREYIKPNSPIRNDCFLESQCPLKQCQNTGICLDRIRCDCRHTSFQGRFCTKLKTGYWFNESTPGLIFDQPFSKDKPFSNYKLSFGIVTKLSTGEVIRINEQIYLELFRGLLRMKFLGNDFVTNEQIVNDGYYHLVQMEYNATGYLYFNVDNRSVMKQLTKKMIFDKPLLLLIGQNPVFKHSFQGQLYGLESDVYSIFDLISPTFHRISFTPLRNKSLSFSAIIPSSSRTSDESLHPSCSHQPYDDICIVTSDTNGHILVYPNFTTQSSFRSTMKLSSTIRYGNLMNSTDHLLMISVRTPDEQGSWLEKFSWRTIGIFSLAILSGIVICIVVTLCACIKYRRKDAGVYELEETQRFRPLIVELPPSPGESQQDLSNSKSKTKIKSHQQRKRKKSPLIEQREFYI